MTERDFGVQRTILSSLDNRTTVTRLGPERWVTSRLMKVWTWPLRSSEATARLTVLYCDLVGSGMDKLHSSLFLDRTIVAVCETRIPLVLREPCAFCFQDNRRATYKVAINI